MKVGKITLCAAVFALGAATLAFAQDATAPAEQTTTAPETAPAATTEATTPAPTEPTEPVVYPEGITAPPAGMGQIVFFRPSRFVGGGLTFTVREGENDLGRLPNGRYFVHTAEPGIHEYEIGRNDTMRMEIEEGETYYAIQTTQMGVIAGRAVLSPSDADAFTAASDNMRLWVPRNR